MYTPPFSRLPGLYRVMYPISASGRVYAGARRSGPNGESRCCLTLVQAARARSGVATPAMIDHVCALRWIFPSAHDEAPTHSPLSLVPYRYQPAPCPTPVPAAEPLSPLSSAPPLLAAIPPSLASQAHSLMTATNLSRAARYSPAPAASPTR